MKSERIYCILSNYYLYCELTLFRYIFRKLLAYDNAELLLNIYNDTAELLLNIRNDTAELLLNIRNDFWIS
jgi:hypothetical protein